MNKAMTLKDAFDAFGDDERAEALAKSLYVENIVYHKETNQLVLTMQEGTKLSRSDEAVLTACLDLFLNGPSIRFKASQKEKKQDRYQHLSNESCRQKILSQIQSRDPAAGALLKQCSFDFTDKDHLTVTCSPSTMRFLNFRHIDAEKIVEDAVESLGGRAAVTILEGGTKKGKDEALSDPMEEMMKAQLLSNASDDMDTLPSIGEPAIAEPAIADFPAPWEDLPQEDKASRPAGPEPEMPEKAAPEPEETKETAPKPEPAAPQKAESQAPARRTNRVLCGRPINTKDLIPLSKCDVERRGVATQGIVSQMGIREIRNGKGLLTLRITDYVTTVQVKAFVVMKSYHDKIENNLSKGDTVMVKGNLMMDTYAQELALTANSIVLCAEPMKIDEEKKAAIDSMVYGYPFEGEAMPIRRILDQHYEGKVIVQGDIITNETKELRNERSLVTIDITDYTDSISVKVFFDNEDLDKKVGLIKKGKQIKVKGVCSFDEKFSHEFQIMADAIAPSKLPLKPERKDTWEGEKRVELHAHTKISEMDAVTDPGELVRQAARWGHKAVAITDHGVVQGFPSAMDAVEELRKNGQDIKVIYGVEAYLVDDTKKAVYKEHGQNFDSPYVVFDIETTGFDKEKDQILEIGAVKVEGGKITDRYSQFIDPERHIPDNITKLTSITDQDVKGQGTIDKILPEFKKWVGDAALVAHNASFDTGFIANKNEKLGYQPMDNTIVDTLEISRGLFDLNRYTLDSISKHLGVSLENHHRAVDDAGATAEIFVKCLDLLKKDGLTQLSEVNRYIHDHTDVKKLRSHHAIILVKNLKGLRNLYELISLAHIKYFHRQPRTPKSEVDRLREGLLVGSACSAGELYEAVLENDRPEEIERILSFYDYLEIQPVTNNEYLIDDKEHDQVNTVEDLQNINRRIVELGKKYHKPVVATCDVHFKDPQDAIFRKILLASMDYKDVDKMPALYFRTTNEMMDEFAYLGPEDCRKVVITGPNLIADQIEHYLPVPKGQFSPVIEGAEDELRTVCYEKAKSMYGDPLPEIVQERLDRELNCIISNGFGTLYILARRLVLHSVADGYYVGSRGSVGSSFVATMAGITEINPLKAHYYCKKCHYSDFDPPEARKNPGMSGFDLPDRKCPVCGTPLTKDGQEIPFEVFLGFKGDKEPDIDLNFSGEYQPRAHAYVEEMFGKDHVFRAGTMGGLAEKTAYGMVRHYLEDRHLTRSNAQINYLISGCLDVKRTTGQHPGGQIIVPKGYSVYDFTPVQHPANDMTTDIVTTHYDYNQLHGRLLKLDILGHDDPTMIRMLEDLTHTVATDVPVNDKDVMSLFLGTEALGVTPEQIGSPVGTYGISEFGTHFVRQMLVETKPKSFSDLVRISGLSHGTNVWNKNAQEIVAQGIAPISECICTRDDIMVDLIHDGLDKSHAFKIMEIVRKGKKTGGLKPEHIAEMKEHGVPDWYIESCKKIQYLFPKGHAAAYVTMSLRIAYYKVHYKEAYYAAYFTIRADSFDYETMAMGEDKARAAKQAIEDKPVDEQTAKDKETHTLLELVVEFYCRKCQFLPLDLYQSDSHKFRLVDGKLLPPFDTIQGMGQTAAESIVEARRDGPFATITDFLDRTKVSRTITDTMKRLGVFKDTPETDQMSLF